MNCFAFESAGISNLRENKMRLKSLIHWRFAVLSLCTVMTTATLLFSPQVQAAAHSADTPTVNNGKTPRQNPETVQLQEIWRAGDEDSEVIFGHIFRADIDADGNIYLLDTQQSNVPVFSPAGEYLRTLSREGEGPGETTEPVDLTMMPDGTLGILQRFPGKVEKVTFDDVPAGSVVLSDPKEGGFSALFTGRYRNGNLVLVAQQMSNTEKGQKRVWFVSRFDASGNELARCFESSYILDNANPVLTETGVLNPILFGSTVGPDGRVYVASDHNNYSINVYSPDGKLDHVVTREFSARTKTKLERDRLQSVFDVWGRGQLETKIEDNALTVGDIYIDDNNSMWVRHSRSGRFEEGATGFAFDVFDSEGSFQRQVTFLCEANPVDDQIFRVSDDILILVKGSIPAIHASMAGGQGEFEEESDEQEMEVVCFRIPR